VQRFGVTLSIFLASAALLCADEHAPSFERDVAPLLVKHCLGCHNAGELAGGLDLSSWGKLSVGGDSGAPAITPGDLDASYLVDRLRAGDMPPEGKGAPVPAEEAKRLEAWIASGEVWPAGRVLSAFDYTTELRGGRDWWSLKVPTLPAIPVVKSQGWMRTPLDAFILAKLEEAQLQPAPEADRATFIRRVTLDAHGLPPTPEEIAAFVADVSADAYEKLVDRLLASPRYGERWARHWLDVARFGESDGYEMNLPRANAWPYRDWVIDAFNRDLPYPDFILHQLAGDQTGVDAATGFLVGGTHDKVGSPDPELTLNQRANDLDDMISTTSTAFLGLTAGCAKCHDHKFDAISQRDYYSLQAMFAGVQHGQRELRTPDFKERERRATELRERIDLLEREAGELAARNQPLASINPAADGPRRPAVSPLYNIDRFAPVTARLIRFTVLETTGVEPCLDELEVFAAGEVTENVALASAGATATASSVYANGTSDIHRIEHINDAQYGNGRSWISAESGGGWVQLKLAEPTLIDHIAWARDREGKFKDRVTTKYRVEISSSGDGPKDWQIVATSDDRLPVEQASDKSALAAGLPSEVAEQYEQLKGEAAQLRTELALLAPMNAYLGTFKQPGATRIYHRGDPMQQRDEVQPGAIAAVGNALRLPADAPESERRLMLARWIGDAANPLTARVMVNRIWHYHFGHGLVGTPSDFGFNGGRPSHPELLDYLACQLIASGWRPKQIHRQILLSATYRQSSKWNDAAAAVDSGGRLLWRFPPRRLEAEAIHDCILATSGVLNLSMGGPGYSPFKPNDNYVRVYEPLEKFGPAQWRRMIYQEKTRSRQDGVFGQFDCPDATQVVGRRNVSTTALQALNLLNASFIIEQSRLLAERLEREADSTEERIRRAFWLALGREPEDDEFTGATDLIETQGLPIFCRALFNANEFVYVN
jgi:hypothetical protein